MVVRTIVGLDCGRNSVVACPISEPIADLKTFARSYEPQVFYANRADLNRLIEIGDIFLMEPTGSDHRIFADYIQRSGKPVYFCKGDRIRSHAISRGLSNKADREDAAAIADFGWLALMGQSKIPNAFIDLKFDRLRHLWLALKGVDRASAPLKSQLWARLAFELPEICMTKGGNPRHLPDRPWGDPPTRTIRWMAGLTHFPQYDKLAAESIGPGISEITRTIAVDLVSAEIRRQNLELELTEIESAAPAYCRSVFDEWGIVGNTRIALMAYLLPFERFLDPEGKPITEWVPAPESKRGATFRDRSLKAFTHSLGMGRRISESGRTRGKWKMCGSKDCRSAIFLWINTRVIFGTGKAKPRKKKDETDAAFEQRLKGHKKFKDWLGDIEFDLRAKNVPAWENPAIVAAVAERNNVNLKVAALQTYYGLSPTMQNVNVVQKAMKLSGRFCRLLYRDLLKAYKEEQSSDFF